MLQVLVELLGLRELGGVGVGQLPGWLPRAVSSLTPSLPGASSPDGPAWTEGRAPTLLSTLALHLRVPHPAHRPLSAAPPLALGRLPPGAAPHTVLPVPLLTVVGPLKTCLSVFLLALSSSPFLEMFPSLGSLPSSLLSSLLDRKSTRLNSSH